MLVDGAIGHDLDSAFSRCEMCRSAVVALVYYGLGSSELYELDCQMQGEIEDSEHVRLAAQASTLLQHLDIPPTAASLVGLLLVSEPSGVTHQQLLERLGVSKAAVSGAVRYLEALDLAHYVPVSGTRRRLLRLQPAHLITYLRRRMTHFAGLTATLRSIASARGDQETFTRQIASVAELCARLNDSVNEILDEWEREQR